MNLTHVRLGFLIDAGIAKCIMEQTLPAPNRRLWHGSVLWRNWGDYAEAVCDYLRLKGEVQYPHMSTISAYAVDDFDGDED